MPDGEGIDVRSADAASRSVCDGMIQSARDRNVWVVGGGNLATQFAHAGPVDELLLNVVPVILGAGKPLFDGRLPDALQLRGVRTFDSGLVVLRYACN